MNVFILRREAIARPVAASCCEGRRLDISSQNLMGASMKEGTIDANSGRCPRCNARRLHKSRTLDWKESVVKTVGGRKLRCHECSFSFFQMGSSALATKDIGRVMRQACGYIIALFAVILCLYALWWIVPRLSESGSSESLDLIYSQPLHEAVKETSSPVWSLSSMSTLHRTAAM